MDLFLVDEVAKKRGTDKLKQIVFNITESSGSGSSGTCCNVFDYLFASNANILTLTSQNTNTLSLTSNRIDSSYSEFDSTYITTLTGYNAVLINTEIDYVSNMSITSDKGHFQNMFVQNLTAVTLTTIYTTAQYMSVTSGNFFNLNTENGFICDLTCCELSATSAIISSLFFTNATGSKLNFTNSTGTNLNVLSLTSDRFQFTNSTGTNLNVLSLTGTKLNFVNSTGTNLNVLNLTSDSFQFTNSTGTNLNVLSLTSDRFQFTNSTGTNLNVLSLTGTKLNFSDSTGTNLILLSLTSDSFQYTTATGTSLNSFSLVAGSLTAANQSLDIWGNAYLRNGQGSIYWNSLNTTDSYMRLYHINSGVFEGGYMDFKPIFNFRNGTNGVNAMTLTPTGTMTLSEGLRLPTTGGTPSLLNYFETLNSNLTFGWTDNAGTTATVSVRYHRIGNQVSIMIPQFLVNCGNSARPFIPHSVAIPTRFRPTIQITQPCVCYFGGTSNSNITSTQVEVLTTGFIQIYRDFAKSQFQLTNNGPKDALVINYLIQ